MESINATVEPSETIKGKPIEILEELRELYEEPEDNQTQIKFVEEPD